MQDFRTLDINDPLYPESFKVLGAQAPETLYFYGDLDLIQYQRNISIVGTRVPSLYGKHSTRALVQSLKNYDACIVSGLARGIDSEAHLSALESGLPSIAIIASGLEAYGYGGSQRKIFNEMRKRDDCLIISEFEPKFEARKGSFPYRNRLIAALSPVTILIEASLNSGTLVTAEHALKQGRQVLALPGDISKDSFKGSNKLLAEGLAQPIYSISLLSQYLDLKERNITKESKIPAIDKISETILNLIDIEPVSFDYLMTELGMNQISLSTQLSLLEVKGLLKRESGMKFSKY